MSDEAAKKAATAAKQAKHAVGNIEAAAELQVEEVVTTAVRSIPVPVRQLGAIALPVMGGAAAYHFGHKAVVKFKIRRAEKKAAKLAVDTTSPISAVA
jgi:uncharacterized protein (DUF2062 family)